MKKILVLTAIFVSLSAVEAAEHKDIEQRQQAFTLIEKYTESLEDELDKTELDWNAIASGSLILTASVEQLPERFLLRNHQDGRAKAAIWDKPEKFNALMQELQSGIAQLGVATSAKNREQAIKALEQTQGTCRSCHMGYRSLW